MLEVLKITDFEPKYAQPLAATYAEVFAGPPWNEYTRCPASGKYFGKETEVGGKCVSEQRCEPCQGTLELAYPEDETMSYILGEQAKPEAVVKILKGLGNETLGFAWGYSYETPLALAASKYRTEAMRKVVSDTLSLSGIENRLFYFSECGVREPFRGEGLSNLLAEIMTQNATRFGLDLVMRTNFESPMMAVAERLGMKQVLGPKVAVDRVAKLIRPTGLIINSPDLENRNRVLFVLPAKRQ